ncbi:ABC transporter ATP-binding protein [Bifidobacterium cuniculi]|uniref:ABC transporter ATP-binding protein n=1 Tax=Bifidobacterium cuniculi TaxID=1688 RepID=UPI0005298E5E|nr:ABC transporter ATP-binding protein [Bifidobacterium cuniculi]
MADTPLAVLRGVGRSFPGVRALRDATFELDEGQSVAVTGPSGSGKSTLLSIMGLLDSPTTGTYELCGQDVTHASRARRGVLRRDYVGFVFQAFHLVEHLTVLENVLVGLTIRGCHGAQARGLALDALDRVGLGGKDSRRPLDLSGGERQRVAIARAVALPPRLLLCDEPTGNLDSRNSQLVVELLHDVTGPRTALVLVTHDEAVARSCARRLAVHDGVVQEEGA